MNIMYTCDNNYVWLMAISTISLFENNKEMDDLSVYLIGESISQNNRDELKKIGEQYGRLIEIIDTPELKIPDSLISLRWPLSAFTRLFSGNILPENVERILYLDCDTIISGDISELDKVEFNGKIAYSVKDCISGLYKENIGLHRNSPYFNAGVILFDMSTLRKFDINVEIEAYMKNYANLISYADQDIFNGIFDGRIGTLNPKYNLMTIDLAHTYDEIQKLRRPTNFYTESEIELAKRNPCIIHYTTNMLIVRPWYSNTNHPAKDQFKKYMDVSVWKNKKLNTMEFKSRESRIIRIVIKLSKNRAYSVLGMIHAVFKPLYIRLKAGK